MFEEDEYGESLLRKIETHFEDDSIEAQRKHYELVKKYEEMNESDNVRQLIVQCLVKYMDR